MPTSCVFQLDRQVPSYSSGEYISGRILLKTDKVKRVNAVFVTLEGEAKVQWSISCKSETANYYGRQQYLYTRANVYDNAEFRAGTHVYVLSLRIPAECPSTCKGPYGHIVYNISLTIKKPWSLDEVFRKPITVMQTLNLNEKPEYGLPFTDERVKYLCHWPCASGPISSTLVMAIAAFVPLQQITYFLEVDNQSPHYDVVGVETFLRQHFVFLARKPLRRNYYTKTLTKNKLEEPTLRLTKRLYEGKVTVPEHIPRSTLNHNYIVFLHYSLVVRVKTGCLHYDTDITAPVIIGTVPLQNPNLLITAQPTTRSRETLDTDDDDLAHARELELHGVLANDDPPSYDSCLPPSFSYATLGSKDTLDQSQSELRKDQAHLRVKLPRFPDYGSLTTLAHNINAIEHAAPRDRHFKFDGSLDPQHAEGNLDAFDSNSAILGESEESVFENET